MIPSRFFAAAAFLLLPIPSWLAKLPAADPTLFARIPASGSTPNNFRGVDVVGDEIFTVTYGFFNGNGSLRVVGGSPPAELDASEEFSGARKLEVENGSAHVLWSYTSTGFDWRWGLRIFNASSLEEIDTDNRIFSIGSRAHGLEVQNGLAFVSREGGLTIIDVSHPQVVEGDPDSGPQVLATATGVTDGFDVDVVETTAFVADGPAGLRIFDVTTPASPSALGAWSPAAGNSVRGVKVVDNAGTRTAYLIGSRLWTVDVTNPAAPIELTTASPPENAERIDVANGFAYVAGDFGLRAYSVANPATPAFNGRYNTEHQGEDVQVAGSNIYLADRSGLYILQHGVQTSGTLSTRIRALDESGIANPSQGPDPETGEATPLQPVTDIAELQSQPTGQTGLVADGVTPLLLEVTGNDLQGAPIEVDLEITASNGADASVLDDKLRVLRDGSWEPFSVPGSITLSPGAPTNFLWIEAIDASEIPGGTPTQMQLTATPRQPGFEAARQDFQLRRPPIAITYYGKRIDEQNKGTFSLEWSAESIAIFEADRGADFVHEPFGVLKLDRFDDQERFTRDLHGWMESLQHDWAVTRVDCIADLLSASYVADMCLEEGGGIYLFLQRPPYRNPDNSGRGWFRRVVTVNGNHRGSHLYPYLKALSAGIERLADPATAANSLPATTTQSLSDNSLTQLLREQSFSPTGAMPRALDVKREAYDSSAWFHHIVTTIDPDRAPAYQFLGLSGWRLQQVAPDGSDGLLDLNSARIGPDRPHSIVPGNYSTLPGSGWGADSSAYESPAVARHVLDALAAPPDDPSYRFDAFQPGRPADFTRRTTIRIQLDDGSTRQFTSRRDAIIFAGASAAVALSGMNAVSPEPGPAPRGEDTPLIYEIEPAPGAAPAGDVNWIVETYGPDGATLEGATWEPVPGSPLQAAVSIDPTTLGDTVVFASYPTISGQIVLASPQLARRTEPPGATAVGITVSPADGEVALGSSLDWTVSVEYDDGTQLRRWLAPGEATATSSNPTVIDVSQGTRWKAVGVGVATTTVEYLGFSADAGLTVFDAYPPESFEDWREDQFDSEELADPTISGPGVDLDGDTLNLLLEYASGGLPRSRDDGILALETIDLDGTPRLGLVLRASRTLDAPLLVQRSTDLASWENWFTYQPQTTDLGAAPVVGVEDIGPWRFLTLRDDATMPANENTHFRVAFMHGSQVAGEISGTGELTFDLGGGMLHSYGDRITATTMGTFGYGGLPDFTPNVEASYFGIARAWPNGYGDLQHVVYSDLGALELRLTADLGYRVVLERFDMAAYGREFSSDPTINSVEVIDGSLTTLFSQQNVEISETSHTPFEMPDGIEAEQLSLRFDATNLASSFRDDIGVDNVRFSQRPAFDFGNSTLLTFDIDGLANGAVVPAGYGNRVDGPASGTFSYGGTGTFTPGISIAYGPAGAIPSVWRDGHGEMNNVLYNEFEHVDLLEITLSADPGFQVRLHGFDLAAYGPDFTSDPTVDSVAVLDGAGGERFNATNLTVSEHYRTRIDLTAAPPQAAELTIRIDGTSLGINSEDIGIDNIRFEQVPVN